MDRKEAPMRYTNPKYEAWVRTRPCIICDTPGPSHCHHIKGVGKLSGTGLKAPSWASLPLCHKCHALMHHGKTLWPAQWELALRTIGSAIENGFFKGGAK
jgi:hypothetical protein